MDAPRERLTALGSELVRVHDLLREDLRLLRKGRPATDTAAGLGVLPPGR